MADVDHLMLHLRDDRLPAAKRNQRQRREHQNDRQEPGIVHDTRFLACMCSRPMEIGVSPSTIGNIGQCSTPTVTNSATAMATGMGLLTLRASLTPIESVMPTPTAASPARMA